jgi:hypothetical protein
MSPNSVEFIKEQVAEAKNDLKAVAPGACSACKPLQHLSSIGADVGILVLDAQVELKKQMADTEASVQKQLLVTHDSIVSEITKVKAAIVPPDKRAFGLPVTFIINMIKAGALIVTAASAILGLVLIIREVGESKAERVSRHKDSVTIQTSIDQAADKAEQASDKAEKATALAATALKKTEAKQ